ncbi:uncharacterized protein LOC134853368 [Symsagittifera roscoffensis]|uniref:uncharacterized protein LOC134846921 n=1 Tax=Symsagittifera roscoffensis TaxID=84072 RepID=UPI00307BEC7A
MGRTTDIRCGGRSESCVMILHDFHRDPSNRYWKPGRSILPLPDTKTALSLRVQRKGIFCCFQRRFLPSVHTHVQGTHSSLHQHNQQNSLPAPHQSSSTLNSNHTNQQAPTGNSSSKASPAQFPLQSITNTPQHLTTPPSLSMHHQSTSGQSVGAAGDAQGYHTSDRNQPQTSGHPPSLLHYAASPVTQSNQTQFTSGATSENYNGVGGNDNLEGGRSLRELNSLEDLSRQEQFLMSSVGNYLTHSTT